MRLISDETIEWIKWREGVHSRKCGNDNYNKGWDTGCRILCGHILERIDHDNPTTPPELSVMVARIEAMYGNVELKGGKYHSPYFVSDGYQPLGMGETPEEAWTAAYEDMLAKINSVFEIGGAK